MYAYILSTYYLHLHISGHYSGHQFKTSTNTVRAISLIYNTYTYICMQNYISTYYLHLHISGHYSGHQFKTSTNNRASDKFHIHLQTYISMHNYISIYYLHIYICLSGLLLIVWQVLFV